MKLSSAFIALAACVVGANAQACSSYVVRKELRSLTATEWSRTVRVVNLLQQSGWFAWYAYLHTANFEIIHGCEIFFPFHRRFLRDFESVGQQYDPQFFLPYWDEMRDYANPAASTILSANYIGTNGKGSDSCVQDGNVANWKMTYPNSHCLRRQYNNGSTISAWYSPEYMQSILSRSTAMSQLRPAIEYSIHGSVHLALGGDMVMDWSPNDFAFWLHHANIDRLWFVWQMQNPAQNFWNVAGVDANGKSLNLLSTIPYYGDQILSTMQPGYMNMCFYYDNSQTIARKRSLPNKRDEMKCIPRPAAAIPPLNDGVFDDVDALPIPSDTYIKDTIVASLPSDVLNKWFPTYTNGSGASQNSTTDYSNVPPAPINDADYSSSSVSDESSSQSASGASSEESDYSDVDDSIDSESSDFPIDGDYSAIVVPTDNGSGILNENQSTEGEYSQSYQMFDADENPDAYGIDGSGPKYPMPNPFPLTAQWVKMHHLSPDVIREHYSQATEFVTDLNSAGYQSPFAKGATDNTDGSASSDASSSADNASSSDDASVEDVAAPADAAANTDTVTA
ncbi:hypothetical protein LPJ53_000181 [Coemansia erecta]|uniref:Tyrosinase copper-binding domain-containing protein n=1 Tax=Coemansia erecta TaxID=147472 RepID=A0A9W7Y8G3_9FUNG|nr:hypothetical protein LPJ53_000181 [Coemansia erecta]